MLWSYKGRSQNLEDRRDDVSGPGGFRLGRAGAGLGVGTTLSRGYVTPDSFTHGSAAQRTGWFRRGLESGELSACDTFGC
jgi:predicted metalloprotease